MFKWQSINPCNSVQIEFNPSGVFGIDETSQFYATSYLDNSEFADTAQLLRTASGERSSSLFLLMAEMEAYKIPLFLSIQNVEEPFPHFVYLLRRSTA